MIVYYGNQAVNLANVIEFDVYAELDAVNLTEVTLKWAPGDDGEQGIVIGVDKPKHVDTYEFSKTIMHCLLSKLNTHSEPAKALPFEGIIQQALSVLKGTSNIRFCTKTDMDMPNY